MLIKKFTALIALILVAALFLSACTPQGVTVAPESAAPPNPTASPTPPPVAVTPAPPTAAPEPSFVIYEYGEPSAIVEQEHSFFSCYLLYPTTGLAEVDGVISGWAHEVYDSARAEILALRETDPSAEGEINVQYNAYRVSDNFVSVVEFVFYSHSGLAHPIERVKVFNIDIANGALVANDRVLSVERHAEALALLRGKIVAELPQLDEVLGDLRDDWLDNLVVTHEGVDVVLARGEHLPSVVGTRSYTLTFEELGDAFVLLNEPPEPQPSATPEPSHAFYPPPQISVPPNRELDPDKPMIA
ncbi:MAG: hypothetical protein LBN30_05910, partial [Oscillospiraceae bacterium]|nr:hypothetical protein [Oscillospiraceae bacterium]